MELTEKRISRNIIFEGKVFSVAKDINVLPDGREAPREIVLHNGGAGILPVDEDGNVTLVRQYRCGIENINLEICAGKKEQGEDPAGCALRELAEELGLRASVIRSLGTIAATPAYDSEIMYIYLATGLKPVGQSLDDGEFLEIVKMPLADAVEMVMAGMITDAKTQIALLKAKRLLDGED